MRPVWITVLCILCSVPASAESTRLTLADAVKTALDHSYDMRIAALESDRASSALGETRASYLPRLSVTANAGYSNRFDERLRAVDGKGIVRTYGLSNIGSSEGWVNVYIDQVLFDLAQLRLIERESLTADASRLAEVQRREDVAYEVTRSYADLVRLQQLADLAATTVAAAERTDEQARALLSGGRALASEREQAALFLEEARLRVRAREDDITAAARTLQRIMGNGSSALPLLVPESLPDPGAGTIPVPGDDLLAETPELQALSLHRRIEEATVASARAGRLPRFRVRGGYSHYGIKRFDNFPDETYVWVGMDMPIFDGFRVESAVEGAKKGVEIAELRYRATLEGKRGQIRELTQRLVDVGRRAELAERQAANAREEWRLAELRLRAQRSSLTQALDANERSVQRSQGAIDARFDQVELWASVYRALGQLADTIVADHGAAVAPVDD